MKPEETIQTGFISWWQYAHKGFGLSDHRTLFMVPNGSYLGGGFKQLASGKQVSLSAIRFGKLKRMGYVNGVSDILCIVPRGDFHGICMEFKAGKAGKVSPDQDALMAIFTEHKWQAVVVRSLDEAIGAITKYLNKGDANFKA